jgi:hypothetical protein
MHKDRFSRASLAFEVTSVPNLRQAIDGVDGFIWRLEDRKRLIYIVKESIFTFLLAPKIC